MKVTGRWLATVALMITAVPVLMAETNEEKEVRYMEMVARADSCIGAEDYAEAIRQLQEAMRLLPSNPNNILLLSNMGMLHYYLGNDSVAVETLNMAHEMAPASVTVLLNRGRVNNTLGREADALRDFTEAARLDSTLTEAWVQRGLLQLRGGDVRGAEASLARAEELDPESRETVVSKALLYSKTNRPKEALPYLNRLIKKEQQSEYYVERAMCRLQLDDLGGAAEDIADGLKLDAGNGDLYVARALLNKRRYREKDAQKDAEQAVKLGADPRLLKLYGL